MKIWIWVEKSIFVSFCHVYSIIRARGKMIQLTNHFEWYSSINVTLFLYFFLPSCSLYLTVYYLFKINKIYPAIKEEKNNSEKWTILPRSPLWPENLEKLGEVIKNNFLTAMSGLRRSIQEGPNALVAHLGDGDVLACG